MIYEVNWPRLCLGLLILSGAVFLSFQLGYTIRGGSYFPIQFYYLFSGAIVGIIVGVTKLLTFSRKGLIGGSLIGILFPVTLFTLYWFGVALAPDAAFRCDIPFYAREIDTRYAQYGKYPDEVGRIAIHEYAPYPCPHHANGYGILYSHTADYYILGRFSTPYPGSFDYTPLSPMLGSRVCIYDSRTAELSCGFNTWAPFSAPTKKDEKVINP